MIWDILRELTREQRRQLFKEKVISGCLYRSFDDFEANIFFRFCLRSFADRKELRESLELEGQKRLDATLKKFEDVDIYDPMHGKLHLNPDFMETVDQYIDDPSLEETEANTIQEERSSFQSYSLLGLLFKNERDQKQINDILRYCRLTKIQYEDTFPLSSDNFKFICANVATKIGTLIKGFLKYRRNQTNNMRQTIKNIISLNFLDPKKEYIVRPEKKSLLIQLSHLKLIKIDPSLTKFRIADSLHHFAFQGKKQSDMNSQLNCEVIIETNFKIYAKIKSRVPDRQDFKNFKGIMRKLVELEQFEMEELIIGKITEEKMKAIFKQGVTVSNFFDFFKQYIDPGTALEKDLGKWKKLKFLGLQGPEEDSVIPNNVRQEVKLWQTLYNSRRR